MSQEKSGDKSEAHTLTQGAAEERGGDAVATREADEAGASVASQDDGVDEESVSGTSQDDDVDEESVSGTSQGNGVDEAGASVASQDGDLDEESASQEVEGAAAKVVTFEEEPTPPETGAGWTLWLWCGIPFVVAVATICAVMHPPMLDWSQHIAQGVLLARQGDPAFVIPEVYCVQPFAPYHSFHYVVRVLYPLFGSSWISRGTLLFVFLLYGLSLFFLVRSFGGDLRVLGLAPPLFFGALYRLGFAPNLLGLVLAFATLALAERWRRDPTRQNGLLLTVALLLTWMVHPLPFYFALGCTGAFLLIALWGRWASLKEASKWLAAPLAVGGFYGAWLFVYGKQYTNFRGLEPTIWQKLVMLTEELWGVARVAPRERLLAGVFLVGLALLLLAVVGRLLRGKGSLDAWGWAKVCIVALAFGAYTFGKWRMLGGFFVFNRFLTPAILLALCLAPLSHSRVRTLILGLMWLAGVGFLLQNWQVHQRWDRQIRDLHRLYAKIPKGRKLIGLTPRFRDRICRFEVLRRAPIFVQQHRGGEVRYAFTHFAHMPVRDCNPKRHIKTLPLKDQPWRFSPAAHGPYADFLLLYISRHPRTNHILFRWLTPNSPFQVKARAGRWWLISRKAKSQ